MEIFKIDFRGVFEPIIVSDLTKSEISEIKSIKNKITTGEYAGYHPENSRKYQMIHRLVKNKIISTQIV